MNRSVKVVAVACLVVLFGAYGLSLAARNDDASLAVSPSPCAHPGTYTVTGSGFRADDRVAVTLSRQCTDGVMYQYLIWTGQADGSGSISFSRPTESCAGVYTLSASQAKEHGRGATASVTFVVY